MAMELKTNTAVRVTVGPFIDVTDGKTPEVALTATNEHLTLVVDTGGVPTLVLDANATASGGNNDMVHITNDDAGYYDLELTAAQLNYVGNAKLSINYVTDHLPVFHEIQIVSAQYWDAKYGTGNFSADAKAINGVATTSVTTVSAYQGTTAASTAQTGDSYAVVAHTDYGNAKLVRSTTPANTLTVDAAHLVAVPATQKVDVETIKTNPVVNAGTVTFPTGATLASTTNITGGTITTVTNLTNLPAIPANWITAAGIADAAIDNATFAADVGSTAYATNIIALAVNKTIVQQRLDHLVAVADADDVVDDSIIAKLACKAATADWSGYVNTTDSLEALRDRGDAAWITATGFATPTNITAGTITTVTNLTNAPTSGDLTATMKTSVTTACTASTPTAAAVTANVNADVKKVNGVTLTGDGAATPWGPA
jgi:hypothetical protein